MPPSSTSPRASGHSVTAVLVCHDGAPWLPEALAALDAQVRPPERFVAVDIGSTDSSRRLVAAAWGPSAVVALAGDTPFGAAVQAGLDAFEDSRDPALVEWLWVLHGDAAPAPDALDELVNRVVDSPSVWMAGPKLRDWEGARLMQAGLRVDAGGHLDTGLDGPEVDQGQRDDLDEVLAVGSTGALIRRDAWDRLGGLDPEFSTEMADVDLGWRINAADGRVVLASRAVVNHAAFEATDLLSRQRVGLELLERRRQGMQVVLVNTSAWLVPLLLLRYVVGGLLRAAGLLVVARRPAEAQAEALAMAGVLARPRQLIAGRARRRRTRQVRHRDVRHLLPPAGSRWRHAMLPTGIRGRRGGEVRSGGTHETGPVDPDAESLATEATAVGRLLRRPAVLLFAVMALLALVADRGVLSTTLHGGQLLPTPRGASDLWSTYLASWHPSAVGGSVATPPSIAVLATLSTIALGKAWFVVDVILLGAVPLAALSAYVSLGAVTRSVRPRLWLAAVYALLPAVTGAVAGGRIDVAAAAILLPIVMRAVAAAVRDDAANGEWHRGVGAGLLLAVLAALVPLAWVAAVVALLALLAAAALEAADGGRLIRQVRTAAVILLVVPIALLPWTWHVLAHPGLLWSGVGLPEVYSAQHAPLGLSMALLRPGGAAQPEVWVAIPLLLVAVLGLARGRAVTAARAGGVLVLLGVVAAILVTRTAGFAAGVPASRHWPGFWLLLAGGGAVLAAAVATIDARQALRRFSFGWRQPAAIALAVIALAATATMALGWIVRGAGSPLTGSSPDLLPAFTQAELAQPDSPRALVLDATGPNVRYALVRRSAGPLLTDAVTRPNPSGAASTHLAAAVRDLVGGRAGAGNELAPFGIGYVVATQRSAAAVAPGLGKAPDLTVEPAPGETVWRLSSAAGELSVLTPTAATAAKAGRVPSVPPALILPARAGSADVQVEAGSAGRLLVLAEPASSHWQASLDGQSLPAVTAYGWAQAFELPTSGGHLTVGFDATGRSWWLAIQLIVLVALVLLALPPWRRATVEDAGPIDEA